MVARFFAAASARAFSRYVVTGGRKAAENRQNLA